jgi:hypothetical protein
MMSLVTCLAAGFSVTSGSPKEGEGMKVRRDASAGAKISIATDLRSR